MPVKKQSNEAKPSDCAKCDDQVRKMVEFRSMGGVTQFGQEVRARALSGVKTWRLLFWPQNQVAKAAQGTFFINLINSERSSYPILSVLTTP